MTLDLPNIIGLIGSVLMAAAFAYSNIAKQPNFVLFNGANLVGALMLIASLTVHFNVAAMAMEVLWAIIAFFGLAKALRQRAS